MQLYTPKDVSIILNKSRKTVYRYIREFRIPTIAHRGRRGGKELFISEDDLKDFIEDHFNDFDRLAWSVRLIKKYSLLKSNNK